MTKQEQKVIELEKRIALLESQRPIINVYPYQQPVCSPYYYPNYSSGQNRITS